MAKRSTIGRDPFSDGRPGCSFVIHTNPETNIVDLAAVAAAKDSATPAPVAEAPAEIRPAEIYIEIIHIEDAKARRAVGGRLEIFGGDLGAGASTIWRHGSRQAIGFFAPTGRLIDLNAELDSVATAQDRTEHRVLSTLGWAWVIGSLGGIIGIMAGGGLRLLSPRRMILQLRLTDGGTLVVRTDSVTASGLAALARRKP